MNGKKWLSQSELGG